MEMYNEDVTPDTSMFRGTNVPVDPPSFDQQPTLTDKRRIVLIFTGINLVSKSNSFETGKKIINLFCVSRFCV